VTFGEVVVDIGRRRVSRAGEEVKLTHLEFELLVFLVGNPGRAFTRHELLREVWGISHSGSPRTVDNFVGQLRSKLETDPDQPKHIITVRGTGYRFDP
jgi:two-component system KDP operon response regulator KdpE